MAKNGDLRFNERFHKYDVFKDGKFRTVPSVSKIKGQLEKPALIFWAANCTSAYLIKEVIPLIQSGDLVLDDLDTKELFKKAKNYHREVSAEACQIGTDTHNAIERYTLTGQTPIGLSEQANNSFNAYIELEKRIDIKSPIATEKPFYCAEFDFCGTFDRLSYIGDKLFVVDYKTSKAFYDIDMTCQLAAYKMGAEELIKNGEINLPPETKIDGIGIIRLDKETGIPEYRDYSPWIDIATQLFISLRDVLTLQDDFKKTKGISY